MSAIGNPFLDTTTGTMYGRRARPSPARPEAPRTQVRPGMIGASFGGMGQTRGAGVWSQDAEGNPQYLGRYGTHVPGTSIDAGDRRVGSADYTGFAGLQNFLGNTGAAGANYLRSMGIMPSYNGVPLDQANAGGITPQWTNMGTGAPGSAATAMSGRFSGDPDMAAMRGVGTPAAGYNYGAFSRPPAGAITGGTVGTSSAPGGPEGSELAGLTEGGYAGLLRNGGSPFSADMRARLLNQQGDTIARGTQDAIEQARLDAVRRGDTSGSTLGDVEGRIRARGAADMASSRLQGEAGMSQQSLQNLLAGLQGASGYVRDQNQLQLLLGQLQAQGGLGGLQIALGGR